MPATDQVPTVASISLEQIDETWAVHEHFADGTEWTSWHATEVDARFYLLDRLQPRA